MIRLGVEAFPVSFNLNFAFKFFLDFKLVGVFVGQNNVEQEKIKEYEFQEMRWEFP